MEELILTARHKKIIEKTQQLVENKSVEILKFRSRKLVEHLVDDLFIEGGGNLILEKKKKLREEQGENGGKKNKFIPIPNSFAQKVSFLVDHDILPDIYKDAIIYISKEANKEVHANIEDSVAAYAKSLVNLSKPVVDWYFKVHLGHPNIEKLQLYQRREEKNIDVKDSSVINKQFLSPSLKQQDSGKSKWSKTIIFSISISLVVACLIFYKWRDVFLNTNPCDIFNNEYSTKVLIIPFEGLENSNQIGLDVQSKLQEILNRDNLNAEIVYVDKSKEFKTSNNTIYEYQKIMKKHCADHLIFGTNKNDNCNVDGDYICSNYVFRYPPFELDGIVGGFIDGDVEFTAYWNAFFIAYWYQDFTTALDYLDYLLSKPSNNNFLKYYYKGCTLRELNRFNDALASFDQAIKLNPSDAKLLNNIALTHNRMGNLETAIKYYNQSISLDSTNSDWFYQRGVVNSKLGNFIKAEQDAFNALKIDTSNGKNLSYNLLGHNAYMQDKMEEAVNYFSQHINTTNNSKKTINSLWYRGYILGKYFNKHEEALKDLILVLDIDPNYHQTASDFLFNVLRVQSNELALEYVNFYLDKIPHQPEGFDARGQIYEKMGNHQQALSDFQKALKTEPNNTSFTANTVDFLLRNKRFEEALQVVNEGLEYDNKDQTLLNRKLVIFINQKKWGEIYYLYAFIYQNNIQTAHLKCNYGTALIANAEKDVALQYYNESIKMDPSVIQFYQFKAMLLSNLGQFSEAIDTYNQVIKLNQNYAAAYYGKAYVLKIGFNNEEGFKQNLDKALSLNNNSYNFGFGDRFDYTTLKYKPKFWKPHPESMWNYHEFEP